MKEFIQNLSELEIYLSHLNVVLKAYERTNGNRDYSKELIKFKEALAKVEALKQYQDKQ